MFVGVKGGQLRRSNFSKPWARALVRAGLPATTHFHDLRHTGNTLSAEAGASLAEPMNRMGQSSARPAMVYLHARDERGQQLAANLDRMARRELRRSGSKPTAIQQARNGHADPRSHRRTGQLIILGIASELGIVGWERVTRIELALSAWEADVLPLNYTRARS